MTTSVQKLPPSWREALLLLIVLIGWILFWYWDTATAMVGIWERSETYAHAFIVPPITLWLIWRQRALVLSEQPRASLILAIPVALTTILWLLGQLTAVNALTQFALIATLVLAIMALLGVQVSKRIAFPLAFLFFSVPIGDFMMPKLMDWTAAFTVLALRISGIPVYQEGLQFVIPSGNWSVVEACSGIRYIIASLTVGTLFAYLNYVSLRRRVIFIAISAIVPVIANWLRAYLIVLLGHISGNKLAAGVDHLIYGWLFFGLVIMVMFMIGARWSESDPDEGVSTNLVQKHRAPGITPWLASAGIALLATMGPLAFVAIDHADKAAPPNLARLVPPEGWTEDSPISSWRPAYANPSAEFQTSYRNNERKVGIYIAYYRNQNYERKLVTSTNLLTEFKDQVWSTINQGNEQVVINGKVLQIRTAELLGKETTPAVRLKVWRWYWINGRLASNDIEAKFYTALSRLLGHGDDSAVVMLYTPLDQTGSPDATLEAFAADTSQNIAKMLLQTRDQR